MPYHTNNIHNCRSVRVGAMEGTRGSPLRGYQETEEQSSVYASLTAIRLEYTEGECAGCHGVKPLVNGYCEVCRSCGANERQCLDPYEIEYRSERGKRNGKRSTWHKQ